MGYAVQPYTCTHRRFQQAKSCLFPSRLLKDGDIRKKLLGSISISLSCTTTSTCTRAGPLPNMGKVLFLLFECHFSSNRSTHMDPKVPWNNLSFSLCFQFFNASWQLIENKKEFKSLSLLIWKLHETTSVLCACNTAKHSRVRSCTCRNLENSIKINGSVPFYTNKKCGLHDCTLCLAHFPCRLPQIQCYLLNSRRSSYVKFKSHDCTLKAI